MIHPFFLSIGAYLVSFGLFFAIVIGDGWYMIGSMQSGGQTSTSAAMPGMNDDLDKLQQAQQLQKTIREVKQQVRQQQSGAPENVYNQQQQLQDLQITVSENQQSELESATETQPAQMNELGLKLLKKALPLVILAGLAFLWGLFYFPAACAVAGYTRSFTATLNPKIGWDTIKNLGSDYPLILLMSLIIAVAALIAAVILRIAFSAFALPQIGNIPAIAVLSWITFYFWIVFSCVLGYAIGKKSDELGIYQG